MKTQFLRRLLSRTQKLNKEHVVDVLVDVVEERDLMRLLFDTMVEGMVVVTSDRSVTYVNETAAEILGIPTEAANQSLDKVFSSTELRELCKMGLDIEDAIRDREVAIEANGQDRTLRVNILPLRHHDGPSLGALVLFMDVTEQRLQEARLRRAEKLAALTTLSAGVTHEIRNPLNALGIHLQLLKRQIAKEKLEENQDIQGTIAVLEREVKRLNEVMEMFLRATRPAKPEFRRTDIIDLITQTLQLLRPELESREIDIQFIQTIKRPEILADDRLFSQVFINLIKNAAEAIDEAVAELGDRVKRQIVIQVDADDEATVIRISDSGAGMLREDMERIFEPYFTTKESGTGLGLMVSESIIRQHGGQLDVQSEVGVGTDFIITLPPPQEPTRLLESEKKRSG